ncbi:MAG: tetratricopeptide repeat protein [Acidimicrobiales bacterium]
MPTTTEFERALELKRSGRLDEAVIALESLLSRRSSDAVALAQLADVQLRRRRLADAADALDRAEAIAGTTTLTARLRGDLRYREQRWREAARCYQDAVALGDSGTWSLIQIGRCHLRLGDLDAARGAAARAVERDETTSGAWLLLGEVARREERFADALELFQRAHDNKPADEYAYAKLMEARILQLPPDDREREIDVLLNSAGRANRHLVGVLARIRSERGDEERAADAWRARREQLGGDLFARKQEAYALRRAGKLDDAATLMRSCLLEDPADVILFRTYIHLQRRRDARDELRATLEELIPLAGSRRGAVYGELRKLATD